MLFSAIKWKTQYNISKIYLYWIHKIYKLIKKVIDKISNKILE